MSEAWRHEKHHFKFNLAEPHQQTVVWREWIAGKAGNTFRHVAVTYDKPSGMAHPHVNGVVVGESNFGTFTP
jgi:hypothetical protein